jgi:hypothetical protein
VKTFFLPLFILIATTAFSQQVDLKGQVLDLGFNNEPLAFANVRVRGLDIEAVADENGNYKLALTPGVYTLEFEFIGYETHLISDVKVEASDLELDPVVLGARRMKKDINVALNESEMEPSRSND